MELENLTIDYQSLWDEPRLTEMEKAYKKRHKVQKFNYDFRPSILKLHLHTMRGIDLCYQIKLTEESLIYTNTTHEFTLHILLNDAFSETDKDLVQNIMFPTAEFLFQKQTEVFISFNKVLQQRYMILIHALHEIWENKLE